jgi:hypothetical protein
MDWKPTWKPPGSPRHTSGSKDSAIHAAVNGDERVLRVIFQSLFDSPDGPQAMTWWEPNKSQGRTF